MYNPNECIRLVRMHRPQVAGKGMAEAKLQFGVMCHGTTLEAWEARCLHKLLEVPGVELALLIVEGQPAAPPPGRRPLRALRNLLLGRSTLWDLYMLWARPRLASRRPVTMAGKLAGVPTLECQPIQDESGAWRLDEADLQRIREHRLSFILRFGGDMLRRVTIDAAEHGVWSFRHHYTPGRRHGLPGFWEVYDRAAIIETSLERVTDRPDRAVVLQRGAFRAELGLNGYVHNHDKAAFASALWPARVCRDLLYGEASYLRAAPAPVTPFVHRQPAAWQALVFLLRSAQDELRIKLNWLFREEQWNVGYSPTPIHRLLERPELSDVRWYPASPRHEFLADPIALDRDGHITVMAEHYDYRTRKGRLMALSFDHGHPAGTAALALEEPWHLAYPLLVQDGPSLYCIPEGSDSGRVWAYRAQEFPHTWQRVGPLLDHAQVVDPTVFRHEDRWWMLGMPTGEYPEQGFVQLHAWYADGLLGPWTAHHCNPLKLDVRNSRPAGPVFRHEGRLYRPAQDCSGRYGSAIAINEVLHLSPSRFEERTVARLAPSPDWPYPAGVHTLCAVDGGVVLDARRMIFVPRCFKERLRELLRDKGER